MRVLGHAQAVTTRTQSIDNDLTISLQALIGVPSPQNKSAEVPGMIMPFAFAMRTEMMEHELTAVRQTHRKAQERTQCSRVRMKSEDTKLVRWEQERTPAPAFINEREIGIVDFNFRGRAHTQRIASFVLASAISFVLETGCGFKMRIQTKSSHLAFTSISLGYG